MAGRERRMCKVEACDTSSPGDAGPRQREFRVFSSLVQLPLCVFSVISRCSDCCAIMVGTNLSPHHTTVHWGRKQVQELPRHRVVTDAQAIAYRQALQLDALAVQLVLVGAPDVVPYHRNVVPPI
jgi:hypothetical protein